MAQARALLAPEIAEGQATFDAHHASGRFPRPKPAARWEDTGTVAFQTYSWRGEDFVHVHLFAGEACDVNASVSALFRRGSEGLTRVDAYVAGDAPEVLLDVDGDGELEAIVSPTFRFATHLQGFIDGHPRISNETPDYGCPC